MATEPKGKRDIPAFSENPSIPLAAQTAKTGTRRIANKTGDKCMIVSDSGDVLAPAGFHEILEVDRTQFVKMYVGGIRAFHDLSNAGVKVFDLVYRLMLKSPNNDTLYLSYKEAPRMSRATFDRGIIELLQKEILYKSTRPYLYYINITYMFNGDRFALIKEYRLKEECGATRETSAQWDLPL